VETGDAVDGVPTKALEGETPATAEPGIMLEPKQNDTLNAQLQDFLKKNDGIPKKKRTYKKKERAITVIEAMKIINETTTATEGGTWK
jgi:hypothetical protein